MSLEHPAQILTTHDLGNLRILQQQHHHHHHQQQQQQQQHNLATAVGTNVAATTTTTPKTIFGGNLKSLNGNPNMIFSTIPLDGRPLIIPTIGNGTQSQTSTNSQQHQQQSQQQQQQQRFTVTSQSTNGFRTGNIVSTIATSPATSATVAGNNISNLLAAAGVTTKATILNAANTNNHNNINNSSGNVSISVSSGNTNGSTMPTTSKYLFVQQNSNGQYTTYEGSATTATATGNGSTNVGNIVLLATEPLNGSSSEPHHVITTASATPGGDNDEELRSLAWLNDSNLIKGIVTTTGTATAGGNNSNNNTNGLSTKRSNICIVNAANAHDLIEELPPHVASEENVIATTHTVEGVATPQITTLSANDFQQQFIASNKRYTPISGNNPGGGSNNQLSTLANFALAHEAAGANTTREATPHHIYGNIAAIGATTSVHVGPSGTTTVVEYKTTNGNFLPSQRQLLNGGNIATISVAGNNNNSSTPITTITATNLSSNNQNNNNNTNTIVPSSISSVCSSSSSSSSSSSTITGVAGSMQKTLMTIPNATTLITTTTTNAANANGNHHQQQSVVNGNNTTNTIYQGQKPHNTNNNTTSNSTTIPAATTATTTHHPHKKYLREKMNVLDHGGGGGGGGGVNVGVGGSPVVNSNSNGNTNSGVALALVVSTAPTVISPQTATPASTITVVASPASSLSSSSSSSSTSSSTAAVNGGNSPVSKSFFSLGNGNGGPAATAVNYVSNSSNSPSPPTTASALSHTTLYVTTTPSSLSTPLSTTYTIVDQTNQQNVGSSPAIISSPEPQSTKDYYTLTLSQNNSHHHQKRLHHQSLQQHQQPQQQQQQHQIQHNHQQQNHSHNSMRSPISHSSYDNDSLKDFEISPTESSVASTGARLSAASTPQHHSSNQAYHTQSSTSGKLSSSHGGAAGNTTPQKQKHPNNVPYDPLVHTHNKPPYSFSSLIFMAIEGSLEKALPVKEIYAWIVQHFPYFKTAPTGWKNSVRHNLSLNKSFVKVEKAPNMGKGSLWRVEQQQRQNLMQALARSPFFPNSVGDKLALKGSTNSNGGNVNQGAPNSGFDVVDGAISPPPQTSPPMNTLNSKSHINSRFDPQLFPKLSKTLKDMSEPSGVLSDVPDDEYPSDYSTTNHHINNKSNNNNNSITNNNNNNHKYNNNYALQGNEIGIGGGVAELNGNCNGGGVVMGAFTNYESIERLARDCGADNIDDVNAATAMLALKHGPKVFAETFQNGAPVITSSPSEDHTYSAGGGSAAGSGASTPLINGNSGGGAPILLNSNGNKQNGCDNQSNCASSDAAYESSEESHNVTPEELEDQKRHRDGVDALLSLSVSSVVDSVSCSPIKRPASTSVEEEQMSVCFESNSNMSNASSPQQHVGKMSLLNNNTASYALRHHYPQQQLQQSHYQHNSNNRNNNSGVLDEVYNTQGYYGTNSTANHHQFNSQQHQIHHLTTPSPQKKGKPLRNLRTKMKRKAPWMR